MSEELTNNSWRKVTSIGDAWIICKSKSHRGHVYYFNTETGETAWNLSDTEIKKARKFTKTLESRPGARPIKCPEPNSPPTKLLQTDISSPTKPIKNETRHLIPPFVNQHLPGPVFPNLFNPSALCNALPQISNLSAFNTLNNLGPLNIPSLGCAPNVHLYNPNVWDVNQTQQVFIKPSLVQLATEDPLNVAFNNLPTKLPQSSDYSEQKISVDDGTKQNYPKNRYNLDRQGSALKARQGKPYSTPRKDLRKRIGERTHKPEVLHHPRQQHASIKFPDKAEETKSYEHNEDVIMNHRYAQTHEESSKLDLGPLLVLAPSDANGDMWFVVVDLNVVLSEFQFLNNITDSHDKCHLLVPKHVMSQLNEYVLVYKDIKARRVLRFLSQQIEVGYAVMAETPYNVENDNAKIIVETCFEQIRNNYFLVVITDDDELLSYKDATNINMFSVIEVKNLLKHPLSKQQTTIPKPVPLVLEEIKIIVPNNRRESKDNVEKYMIPAECDLFDKITSKLGVHKNVLKTKLDVDKEKVKNGEIKIPKIASDAGIQTNFKVNYKDVVDGDTAADNMMSSKTDNVQESPKKLLTFTKPNEHFKKREIKLKRSVSNQPSGSNECTQKKSFKWRRKRNTVSTTDNNIDSLSKLKGPQLKNNEADKKGSPEKPPDINDSHNKTPDVIANITYDSTVSSDISVARAVDKSVLSTTNVTIEETSTSGIISDSAIDDTEFSIYCKTQKPKDTRQSIQDVNSLNSDDMSENWSVKRDEWISRFVQAMEDVLIVVLRQDPPFFHKSLPPPWNLHEASQCITVKFGNHCTVKDAADKLSKVIFNVSDAKGHIKMNMTLYQYMQMYSCGVYLLATLKTVTKNSEDIQDAVERLKVLLEDIKNCDLDSSSNEMFADNPHEYSVSPRVTPETSQDVDECIREKQNNIEDIAAVAEKIPDDDKTPSDAVKFIRNIDIKSFFNSLCLKRVTKDDENTNDSIKEQVTQNSSEHPQQTSPQDSVMKSASDPVKVNEPKIIRNFSVCADFENKLKSKLNTPVFEEHDNDLDYEEDYGDYLEEECNGIDGNYTGYNEGYDYFDSEVNYETESQEMPVDPVVYDDNSNKIRYMTHALFSEVKDTLFDIKVLCDFCYEEIDNPQQSVPQRFELLNMARSAHKNLMKLCESLEGMSEQREGSLRPNIRELLKEADSSISHIDDQLLLDFRLIVAECKKHTSVFINSIQNIISTLTQ